jgi:electron transfer flavoprotein beta subunit
MEAALQWKEQHADCTVTALTMGPPQAETVLRECLAMGCNDAVLLSDRAFAGSDTWATSNTLARAIRKLGGADIIFTGQQAIDGDTAQVGAQTATRLDVPQISYVMHISAGPGAALRVRRQLENGYEEIEVTPPVLLMTVKELNTPRYMSIGSIVDAYQQPLCVWGCRDLGLSETDTGIPASPTQVLRSFTPPVRGKGVMFTGQVRESVSKLLEALKAQHCMPEVR